MLAFIGIEFGLILICLFFISLRLDCISELINILLKKENKK